MDNNDVTIVERIEAAAAALEKTLGWLEQRQSLLAGEVDHISATVEQSRREQELLDRLAAAEQELTTLRVAAQSPAVAPLRKTMPASTVDMLAKHGIGEGPVDVKTLDAALAGLSIEQRIAVKSQLLRSGSMA